MMFKSLIARLLIIGQIYSCVFQGVAHGNLAARYDVNNDIYFHGSVDKEHGGMRLALGTNGINQKIEMLEVFEVPDYKTLSTQSIASLKIAQESEKYKKYSEYELVEKDESDEEETQSLSEPESSLKQLNLSSQLSMTKLLDSKEDEILSNSSEASDLEDWLQPLQALEFEHGGITRTEQGAYCTIQGLKISLSNTGEMLVEGCQTDFSKPIFLSGEKSIILHNVEARTLHFMAPLILSTGKSTIDYLTIEGSLQNSSFVNAGNLTAKELFLKNLNSGNTGTIISPKISVAGEMESSGTIDSSEIILEESAALKLLDGSNTNVKTLFLSPQSNLENHANNTHIEVLDGIGGTIDNHGSLVIDEVAKDSKFESIINQNLMGFKLGDVNVDQFKNTGTFTLTKGKLAVNQGKNAGVLNTQHLQVDTSFSNEPGKIIGTPIISGSGEFVNFGMVTSDALKIGIKQFTNKGEVNAKSLVGLDTLEQFNNVKGKKIEIDGDLSFSKLTKINNNGSIKSNEMRLFADQTTNAGKLEAINLTLNGSNPFTNYGTITASQKLKLDLTNFNNAGLVQSPLIDLSKLTHLTNAKDATLDLKGSNFAFTNILVNAGIIKAKEMSLFADQTTNQKSGKLEAATVTLKGSKPFTNYGKITAHQKLKLDLINFTNEGLVESSLIDIAKLSQLKNSKGATFDTRGSNLTFDKITVINDGTFKAGVYDFKGGSFNQNGVIEGKSLKISEGFTTTDGQKISLSDELTHSGSTLSLRGTVNTHKFTKHGNLDLYGTLSVKDRATISGAFNVKSTGVLQGNKGHQLSLTLGAGCDIAGLVDVDNLDANAVMLTGRGKLKCVKSSQLQGNLEIATYAQADLHGLKMDGFKTITNNGKLQLKSQGKSSFTLINNGRASIDAINSYTDRDVAIKILLKNSKTGHLTINKGTFDISAYNGSKGSSENVGTFVDNTSWVWFGGFKNTGLWTSPSSRLLFDYSGQDMGNYQVNGELHVNSLVDGIKALDGLEQTKAKKVILNAPEINNKLTNIPTTKKYVWPLEMHIKGDINNSFAIWAPKLKIYSKNLQTTGDLFACDDELLLDIEDALEINARVGGKYSSHIFAKKLKVLGRENIPGAKSPDVLYKRNKNGIYSEGQIEIDVSELIDNYFGTIQGTYYKITAPQLLNRSGLIKANEPTLRSKIDVKDIKNIRDDQGSYRTRGHSYESGGKDWCYCHGDRYHRCCNGGLSKDPIYYETSDEAIISSQGILDITYNSLYMLASRITCGGDLTFIAGNKVYKNGDLPPSTTMEARNNYVNHIVARNRIYGDLGVVDIASSFSGANIALRALQATLRNLGIQPNQMGQIVNLSNQNELELPFNTSHNINQYTNTVSVLGKDNADKLDQSIILAHNISVLKQAMGSSFDTLYRGIDALGKNPEQVFSYAFKTVNDYVRVHKDTKSTIRSITLDKKTQTIEVLTNPTLTPQDLLKSGILGVFLEFTKNIHSLESEQKANQDINASMQFVIPASTLKEDGVNAFENVKIIITEGDLEIRTNVRAKNGAIIAEQGSVVIGSAVIRQHSGENYHDALIRTRIEMEEYLRIQGYKDVIFEAAETHSGKRTDIISDTGMVLDKVVETVDHKVTHTSDKHSSTTTKITDITANTNTHSSVKDDVAGEVNIKTPIGLMQQGSTNINVKVKAPAHIQDDVHNRQIVESITVSNKKRGGFFGGWFGITERKATNYNSSTSQSKGCTNAGQSFISMAKERFKAVNPIFKTESHITSKKIEIISGKNQSQSHTQSTFKGAIWNKVKVSSETHTTHSNPTFESNVYLHSNDIILEKVRGSQGVFDKLICDSKPTIIDVDDKHESTSKSQKSLSAGAAMLTKLLVSVAMMYAAPVSGVMGLSGTTAVMANAGFATLCSDTATKLIENDGDPAKTMQALAKSKVAMNVARSMITAGLVKEIGDMAGIKSTDLEIADYAQKATIQSAVNTVLAISIDGQKPEDALRQGLITATLSTATSYLAGKIGGAYKENATDRINWGAHKALHGLLGGLGGGLGSKFFGGKFEDGAVAGALGAVVATTVTEMLKPDVTTEMNKGLKEVLSKREFTEQFMEKAQLSAKWGDFVGALSAFTTGQDVIIAHNSANNATENNCMQAFYALAIAASESYEGYLTVNTLAMAGGLKALLDSIDVKKLNDGFYSFKGKPYKSLEEALQKVMAVPLLYSIFVIAKIQSMMDQHQEINKPLTTPIHESQPKVFGTPIQDPQKPTSEGFDQQQREEFKESFEAYDGSQINIFTKDFKLPGDGKNWIKLRGDQGWKDSETDLVWKKDKLHKDHWDISNTKGKKVIEVDFEGNQIWPDGPKNKNKK